MPLRFVALMASSIVKCPYTTIVAKGKVGGLEETRLCTPVLSYNQSPVQGLMSDIYIQETLPFRVSSRPTPGIVTALRQVNDEV